MPDGSTPPATEITVDAQATVRLDEDDTVYRVVSGEVRVFAILNDDGDGRRHPLLAAGPGDLLFGTGGAAGRAGLSLIVVGIVESRLSPVERAANLAGADGLAALERWVEHLSRAVAGLLPPSPHPPRALRVEDGTQRLKPGEDVSGPSDGLVWMEGDASLLLFGVADVDAEEGLPITRSTMLQSLDESTARIATGTEGMEDGRWRRALSAFHDGLFAAFTTNLALALVDEFNRSREQADAENAAFAATLRTAGDIVVARRPSDSVPREPLHAAVARASALVRGEAVEPPSVPGLDRLPRVAQLKRVVAAAGLAMRPVTLSRRDSSGEFQLAIALTASGDPLVLLPRRRGEMAAIDPVTGTPRPLDAALLKEIRGRTFAIAATLPEETRGVRSLLGLVWRSARRDVLGTALYGALAAVLLLVPAAVVAVLMGHTIPRGDMRALAELSAVLVLGGLAAAAFTYVQGIALVRTESFAEMSAQPALVDRVLRLPLSFFRARSSGDTVQRALGVSFVRRILAQGALVALLGVLFALINLVVMALFSPVLTLAALAVIAVLGVVAWVCLRRAFRHETRALAIDGELTDTALQVVRSVDKIRVAGAETRAFVRWYTRYLDKWREQQAGRVNEGIVATLAATAPLAVATAVFATAATLALPPEPASYGAFAAALAGFLAALAGIVGTIPQAIKASVLLARVRPLVDEPAEQLSGTVEPGTLSGRIDVNGVGLTYGGGTEILSDVWLSVPAGAFVALVGPSGAGKSSLLKVMLGLETPSAGSISLDGQNLAHLDKAAVRLQFGVVMQDGALLPGSILDNLRASANVTVTEAWEALRAAGLEADVKAMPMGIHTVVAQGATLSGGQRQRLMLARALARRPKILFLDEATSALDEATQAEVAQRIAALNITRVAIAHRLSTIRDADMICVMDRGRIVESGTFETLMRDGPLFRTLATRQLV